MRKSLIFVYGVMLFFIPMPIFYDFGEMSFFIVAVDDYSIKDALAIPIPIGAFSLFFAVVFGYLGSVFYKGSFYRVFSPIELILFYIFLIVPFVLYALIVSNLSVTRLFQILLPVFFVSLVSFPSLLRDRVYSFRCFYLGGFVFFTLHFISLFFNSENFLLVDDLYEFSGFFGLKIYQSLVTYPAVLSLFLLLTISFVFSSRINGLLISINKRYFIYTFVFVILYLLSASGRRAFLVEFFTSVVFVFLFSCFFSLRKGVLRRDVVLYFLFFIFLFFLFFLIYFYTPLSFRVVESIGSNKFDSGRISILSNAYDYFSSNMLVLFFGGGDREVPGFHNFFLDQVYRIGLFGSAFVYALMFFVARRALRILNFGTKHPYQRGVFVTLVFVLVFMQSIINSSLSQPYYLVNVLMVYFFIYSLLFSFDS